MGLDRAWSGSFIPSGASLGQFQNRDQLPQGAILVPRDNMIDLMYRRMELWKPRSEIWPLTYGIGFIGVAGALSGIVFNAFIRQKFKLMNFGPIMTFAPSVAIPCFTSMITHQMFVTTPVLIREFNCPLCGEMRAMSLQVVTGFLQPCLVSVFACSVIARYKYTVPVPPATKPRELLQFIAKTLRPIRIQALGLLGLNIVVAMYITQEEGKAALKLQRDVRNLT